MSGDRPRVGGGPAGLKAASSAAERGHDVTLLEAGKALGGQINLAQLLPGRAEFGGITQNLTREAIAAGVSIATGTKVTPQLINDMAPEIVVLATGARPYSAPIEGEDQAHVVSAWQVLEGKANPGARVAIADWRCDWIGLGLAGRLARDGCHVRLMVNGMTAGQTIPQYARDKWLGDLHRLGVDIVPYARLFGVDGDSAYFQHTLSGEPLVLAHVDTVVTSLGHQSVTDLADSMADQKLKEHVIGDARAPIGRGGRSGRPARRLQNLSRDQMARDKAGRALCLGLMPPLRKNLLPDFDPTYVGPVNRRIGARHRCLAREEQPVVNRFGKYGPSISPAR